MRNDDNERDGAERDDIGGLIRAAGKRPAVPAERTERVKTALHAHWSRQVVRRRRVRYLVYTAGLAAAAALATLVALPALRPNPAPVQETRIAGTVESVVGECWSGDRPRTGSHGPVPLAVRQSLTIGSLVTTGDRGRIALRLATGYGVKLDRGSRVRLMAPGILALDAGAVYVDSGDAGGNAGTLRIQTPLGTIQEIGTRYEVRLDQGQVRVRVREGLVILDDGSRAHQIQAASELTLDRDDVATTQGLTADTGAWDWIRELSTVPDLKGLSAREFLEWASKERGWRLVFSTPELERSATDIILGGSAGGLTLEQSLDAVLPACGMSHRVEGNTLVITPTAETPGR